MTAIASVVTDAAGNPVVDSQDDMIAIDDLEDAFIEAFSGGGADMGGEQHVFIGGMDVVQHFTFSRAERLALGFGEGPELGIVKFRVNDDELLAKIISGELPDVSIAGEAVRVQA